MLIAQLTPDTVREVYLRGINLGQAWVGPAADAAITALLQAEVSKAEVLMNIHFRRWRVLTAPEAGLEPVTDYDELGFLIPFLTAEPGQTRYSLILHSHDVQAVTRVRLVTGWTTDDPPVPVTTTLPLWAMRFEVYDEALYVPVELVTSPALAWAVDYLVGLGALPPELVEWCALGAAIQVLSLGGAAADVTGGVAGAALAMDGIDERTTYSGHSQWQGGGVYAGPIRTLELQRAWIDLPALRFRYQNVLGDRSSLPAGAVIPRQPYEQLVSLPLVALP